MFFLTITELIKVVLINVITILIMQAKLATPGLPKSLNKGYAVIIRIYDPNNKTLSRVTNYIANVVM